MQLKFTLILLFIIILLFSCSKSTDPVYEINSEHFDFILYDALTFANIIKVSEELENNYNRILDDLQVSGMPKVTVKVWSDYNNFMEAMENDIGIRYTGATGYIFGMTEFRIYYNSQSPVTAVHEFAHLVTMQINSSIANNPRWLWEAVALYENNEFVHPKTLPYMDSGDYPTLDELNIDYNSSNHYIYNLGYVLLEYVVQTWGMDNVIGLIQNNGNVTKLLGITIQEFESGWYQFIADKYLN
jgi:hypothetical protein